MDGSAQVYLPHLQHSLTTLFAMEECYHSVEDVLLDDYDIYEETDSEGIFKPGFGSNRGSPSSQLQRRFDSEELTDLDLSNSSQGGPRHEPMSNTFDSLEQVFEKIDKIGDEVATVLDRLRDGGRNLCQLAITIDIPLQWVSLRHS